MAGLLSCLMCPSLRGATGLVSIACTAACAGSYGKVYRAVRGGVQDVAVKVLNHTENDPRQIAAFEKVHRLPTLQRKYRWSCT